MWYIRILEYYSAVKWQALLIHATRVNLENIILNKGSQIQKTMHFIILFI